MSTLLKSKKRQSIHSRDLAERLSWLVGRHARAKGYTLHELAEEIETSDEHLISVLGGYEPIDQDLLERLCEAIDIDALDVVENALRVDDKNVGRALSFIESLVPRKHTYKLGVRHVPWGEMLKIEVQAKSPGDAICKARRAGWMYVESVMRVGANRPSLEV